MKLGLVLVLVALGALSHFVLVPTVDGGEAELRGLRRTIAAEIVLGAAVLAATGVLAGLAPATFAAAAARAAASSHVVLSGADYATTVRVRLAVTPGTVGRNAFVASVNDYTAGRPLAGVRSVNLDFSLPAQTAVQPSTLTLARAANGTWQGSALAPSVAGRWSIEVIVEEATTAVDVPLTLLARLPGAR